jgi:uncharacterized protein with PIN domain
MEKFGEFRFVCDAMLGGLARWLRAAGYDASWRPHIDDWDLIHLARREERVLLSSDTGIFRIAIIRDGRLPALWIPHRLSTKKDQLAFVLEHFRLHAGTPRCMACGGALVEVAKTDVAGRVPARSFAQADRFYECDRCRRVFWQGTHWQKIAQVLAEVRGRAGRSQQNLEPNS